MTDEAAINIASPPLNNSLLDASQDKSMNEPWMDLFSASAQSSGGSNRCYFNADAGIVCGWRARSPTANRSYPKANSPSNTRQLLIFD
jgi:hypothetical protein